MLGNKYRQAVGLQQPIRGRDSNGGNTITWAYVVIDDVPAEAVPAQVLTGPSREQLAAGMKHNEVAARINMPWFPDLRPGWRVLWDGQVFAITGYSTDETGRREWRLVCSAGLTDGQ